MDANEFEVRKAAVLGECVVAPAIFEQVVPRWERFMEPFVASLARREQGEHAVTFVQGLLSDLSHKNAESIASRFGQERLPLPNFCVHRRARTPVGTSEWDAVPLRDELARQIGCERGEPDGVSVFAPSSFPKSRRESVGVARQWCGRLGQTDNCQVAVGMGYVSQREHALVDLRLYLPEEWTQDAARMKKAGVRQGTKFRTRHQRVLELLARQGLKRPHQWITGDDELGRSSWFRRDLRALHEQYLLAVPSNTSIRDLEVEPPAGSGVGRPPQRPWQSVSTWTQAQPASAWTEVEVRDGSKGPLLVEVLKRRVRTRDEQRRECADDELLVVIRYRVGTVIATGDSSRGHSPDRPCRSHLLPSTASRENVSVA